MFLQIEGLTKRYSGDITALHDINCSLEKGIYGIIGPNAAGKTTLLRILAGLEDPSAGRISFNGLELTHHKQRLRSVMGYLPQECGFYKTVTGEDMLDYIAVLKGIRDKRMRQYMVDEVIDMVNLNDVRKINAGEYSFGMKRRLGIAQALLGKPELLILDEPLEGIDTGESNRLGELIAQMADCRLVLITTHSLSNVERSCGNLLVLCQGRLLYQGTPSELACLAEGLVWQMEASLQQVEQIRTSIKVVGVQHAGGNAVVRILSPHKPPGRVTPVKARLEEGYLILMSGGRAK